MLIEGPSESNPIRAPDSQVPPLCSRSRCLIDTSTKCDNLVSSEERRLLSLTYAKYRSYASQQHSCAVSYGCVSSTQGQRFSPPFSDWTGMLIAERVKVTDKYTIIGFISSGTYGRVFKAKSRLVLFSFSWERVLMVDGMEESLRSRSLSRIRRGRLLLITLA